MNISLKFSSFLLASILCSFSLFAQVKTQTISVAGNCGMCKNKIEKAAKSAGASYANWNKDTKVLTVKYKSTSTNAAKIEKKVAAAGYDTKNYKATDEAYEKLDACCQYDRDMLSKDKISNDKKEECCGGKCEMKDGKCTMENCKADCCKDGKCEMKDHKSMACCDGKCDMTNGKCNAACKDHNCCKDGKCEMKDHKSMACCDGKCDMANGKCNAACKDHNCCKDGKCEMKEMKHDGAAMNNCKGSCCKKA